MDDFEDVCFVLRLVCTGSSLVLERVRETAVAAERHIKVIEMRAEY